MQLISSPVVCHSILIQTFRLSTGNHRSEEWSKGEGRYSWLERTPSLSLTRLHCGTWPYCSTQIQTSDFEWSIRNTCLLQTPSSIDHSFIALCSEMFVAEMFVVFGKHVEWWGTYIWKRPYRAFEIGRRRNANVNFVPSRPSPADLHQLLLSGPCTMIIHVHRWLTNTNLLAEKPYLSLVGALRLLAT